MSAAVSEASAAVEGVSEYHFHRMPDLNRSTHRRLGQTGSGWVFETICRLVHHVGRVGRPDARKAARELGRLGVGLQAIADEAGVSVAKVRRDLVHLVDLGLVAVCRRNTSSRTDPATGKIVENRTGRSLPVLVFLTIGPEHLREKAGSSGKAGQATVEPSNPSILDGPPAADRDHFGRAIQRERNTEKRPGGDAVGIGTPPAEPGAGLTAGDTRAIHEPPRPPIGRPAASQSVQAADDGLPPRIGRISRPIAKAKAPPKPSGRRPFPEDHREPAVWSGAAEAARLAMLAKLEADRRRAAAELPIRRQGRPAVMPPAPPPPPPPTAAVAVLDSPADPDAAILQAAIEAASARHREAVPHV